MSNIQFVCVVDWGHALYVSFVLHVITVLPVSNFAFIMFTDSQMWSSHVEPSQCVPFFLSIKDMRL